MCPSELAERNSLAQHMLQQRIVIEHMHRPRMLTQTLLQIRDHAPQPRFRKRIEEIEHDWFGGKSELSRVPTNRFQRKALLRFASVLAEIILGSPMQLR